MKFKTTFFSILAFRIFPSITLSYEGNEGGVLWKELFSKYVIITISICNQGEMLSLNCVFLGIKTILISVNGPIWC